jgi:very-short-patch-repair endonuclease
MGGWGDFLYDEIGKPDAMLTYNSKLKGLARELRKNMTDAERLLWSKIRGRQINNLQFYRQRIIGDYIVDFYCPKRSLVIEVDGGQHYIPDGQNSDQKRDEHLKLLGLNVVRFSNIEVLKNIDGVIQKVQELLHIPESHRNP